MTAKLLLESDIGSEVEFVAPTSVCFEISKYNKDWFGIVWGGKLKIFKYSNFPISNRILKKAAEYIVGCQKQQKSSEAKDVGNADKISIIDALTAAYCLDLGLYILTLNEVDFSQKYFNLVSARAVVVGSERTLVYLLKPKQESENSAGS